MQVSIEHNLSDNDLRKAISGIAIGSGIEQEIIDTLSKACSCDDKTPRLPKDKATLELYRAMQAEFKKSERDIKAYTGEITAVPLHKAIGDIPPITKEQMQELVQAIQDRYGFIAAQIQSVDYQPAPDLLERWKNLGLIPQDVTSATFISSIPADMHFIRNAYLMGQFINAVESGKTFAEVMDIARYAPLLKPDLAAIAIAEEQTALYITDNAADLATKVGQLAIKHRNKKIRQMAVDFHGRKLNRITLDREKKEEQGIPTPDRPVETWQQFSSELYHTMDDKVRDWDRLAYYEIEDAKLQGQANKMMEDGNVNKLVYKQPLSTACEQCKHLYLQPDGKTPRLFKLSELIRNGSNIGRKPHPIKGGKINPIGRADGAETLKATAGLLHPWCQCRLYQYHEGLDDPSWLRKSDPYHDIKGEFTSAPEATNLMKTTNGSVIFGNLTDEMLSKTQYKAAPIHLLQGEHTQKYGYGKIHIKKRHWQEIRKAGYKTIEEFVEDVGNNFNAIYQVQKGRLAITKETSRVTAVIEVKKDENKTYFSVVTAYIANKQKFANSEPIWRDSHGPQTVTGEQSPHLSHGFSNNRVPKIPEIPINGLRSG